MASRDDIVIEITPQVLLKAYACGIFPMAESADDPALYWIEPQQRGILLLDDVHVPRRLARTVRQSVYEIRIDTDFEGVISGCAASRPGRRTTWINPKIHGLYRDLFNSGYCHTVETWADGKLVGGLYGVALNGAFFGESMFSIARDASKVALVYLCARLIRGGFSLLDTQFVTEHLKQFGTVEIDRAEFHKLLEKALAHEARFLGACQSTTSPEADPRHSQGEIVLDRARMRCIARDRITHGNRAGIARCAAWPDRSARHAAAARQSSSGGGCGAVSGPWGRCRTMAPAGALSPPVRAAAASRMSATRRTPDAGAG